MYMSIARLLNTGIQDLALELVQEIVFYSAISTKYGTQTLSKSKLAELRLICRTFRLAADPLFFSEINFDYVETSSCFNTTQGYLQTLIEGVDHFCRYAKTLRINYIPRVPPKRKAVAIPLAKACHLELQPGCSTNSEIQEIQADLTQLKAVDNPLEKLSNPEPGCSTESLMQAVITLRNIRTVHWDLRVDQDMDIIIEGLAKLAQLEELYLDFAVYRAAAENTNLVMIPFRRFKRLRCIDIGGHNISNFYPSFVSGCMRQVHEMVKAGAELSSMALNMPKASFNPIDPMQHVLREIYGGVPHQAHPTLRRLRLSGYSLQLDAVTLPHLRGLTSLDISRANILQETGEDGQFWHALQTESVKIKELVIQEVTAPLLQYLESYLGLESLISGREGVFRTRGSRYDQVSAELAIEEAQRLSFELWTVVLPQHKASLVSYMGYNKTETHAPSYMTLDGMSALSHCSNLQNLVFVVHVTWDHKCPTLKPFVEKALVFPRIQFIQIANTDRFCPPRGCGRAVARSLKMYLSQINNICDREVLASAVKVESFHRGTIDGFCEVRVNRKDYSPFVGADGFVSLRRVSK